MAVLFLGFHDVDEDLLLLVYLHFPVVELHLQVLYLGVGLGIGVRTMFEHKCSNSYAYVGQLGLTALLPLLCALLSKFMIFHQFSVQRDVPAGLAALHLHRLHRQKRLYLCFHFLYLLLQLAGPRFQGPVIRLPLQEAVGRVDDGVLRSLLAHLSHQLALDLRALLAGLGAALGPRRRFPANSFYHFCNLEQKGAVVDEPAAVAFDGGFDAPEVRVQLGEGLTD